MNRPYKIWISVIVLVVALIVSLFFSPFDEYFDNNENALSSTTYTNIISEGKQYPGLSLAVNSKNIILSDSSSNTEKHRWIINPSMTSNRAGFIILEGNDQITGCSRINVVLNTNAKTATINIYVKNGKSMNIEDFLNSNTCAM